MQRKSTPLALQMIVSLVALVILTALTVGIPAIVLIQSQLEQQARQQLTGQARTVDVIFSTEQENLANLAALTAERPTLAHLIEASDMAELQSYLDVLQSGSGLDFILLCDSAANPVAHTGVEPPSAACSATSPLLPQSEGESGWLLSAAAVPDTTGKARVIVGRLLSSGYMHQLAGETGLEIILAHQGQFLAGSFPDSQSVWNGLEPDFNAIDKPVPLNFPHSGTLYYVSLYHPDPAGLDILAFYNAASIETTRDKLTRLLGAGLLGVILVGSALGIFLARRISLPLERLRDAATALRQGDLKSPVIARSRMREISQVSIALEDARIALSHSLSALQQEKAWIDQLLASISEGILTLDRKGRITYFSPGAARITGIDPLYATGRLVDQALHTPEDLPAFSLSLPEPGGKPAMIPVISRNGNSPRLTLAVTTGRMAPPEAGKSGMAIVFRDASEEEAMRRLLGDFLANITHEFRTPLAALAASIELLLDQLPSLSLEETRELVNNLYLGSLGLQTLIDNLLEGASIEAGRFQVRPQPADLSQIVRDALRTMQPLLDKYSQHLRLDLPEGLPAVQADARRTGQVLINLLSNAIKWSPAGAEISVQVEPGPQSIKISVGDEGAGLSAEQKQDLFRRFAYLTVQEHRAEAGAGLGLSVVKAIVTAQQGEVGACDRPGGGVIFWFTIPVAEASV